MSALTKIQGVGLLDCFFARLCATFLAALIIAAGWMRSSVAQVAGLPQPEFTLTDQNDVDLLSLNDYLHQKVISIGSGAHPLSDTVYSGADGDWMGTSPDSPSVVSGLIDSFVPGHISNIDCSSVVVSYSVASFGPTSEDFNCTDPENTTWTAAEPTGSTLVSNSQGYVYTKSDGTQIVYVVSGVSGGVPISRPEEIIYPDGRTLTYYYSNSGSTAGYPIAVTRNDGLQLQYTWTQLPTEPTGLLGISSITAVNTAYEYCNPTLGCTLTKTWPIAQFSWSTSGSNVILTIKDSADRTTTYTMDSSDRTTEIQLPSSTGGENITYAYCNSSCTQYTSANTAYPQNYVSSVTRVGDGTWTYTGVPGSPTEPTCSTATYTATNPVNTAKTVTLQNCPWYAPPADPPAGWDPFISMTDEQGEQFDGPGPLIQKTIMPEGNQTVYSWDGRGNLNKETLEPKPSSSLTNIILSGNYDPSCSNPLTCNEPNSTVDGNGNTTNYAYNSSNGEVSSITSPAVAVPSVGNTNPKTEYTYTQRYAWVMNSASNGYVEAATPIWVRSTEIYCLTTAMTSTGCTQASDQVTKTFYYGPDSGPNNLFLRGVAVTWNGVTHITCYGYDQYGNQISVTKPNAGFTNLASCDQFTAQ